MSNSDLIYIEAVRMKELHNKYCSDVSFWSVMLMTLESDYPVKKDRPQAYRHEEKKIKNTIVKYTKRGKLVDREYRYLMRKYKRTLAREYKRLGREKRI